MILCLLATPRLAASPALSACTTDTHDLVNFSPSLPQKHKE